MAKYGNVVGRSLLCVWAYPYWEERGGTLNVCVCVCMCVCVGAGGGFSSLMDGMAVKGKSMAAANVGVRWRGKGVDSCLQVGVKTLGGLMCVRAGGEGMFWPSAVHDSP